MFTKDVKDATNIVNDKDLEEALKLCMYMCVLLICSNNMFVQMCILIAKQQYEIEEQQRAILADAQMYLQKYALKKEIQFMPSNVAQAVSIYNDPKRHVLYWFLSYRPFTVPIGKEFEDASSYIFVGPPTDVLNNFLSKFENPFQFYLNGSKKKTNILGGGMCIC